MSGIAARRTLSKSLHPSSCPRAPRATGTATVIVHSRAFSSNHRFRQESQNSTDLLEQYSKKSIQDSSVQSGWQLLCWPSSRGYRGKEEVGPQPGMSDRKLIRRTLSSEDADSSDLREIEGERVQLRGFISGSRKAARSVVFADLVDPWLQNITQLVLDFRSISMPTTSDAQDGGSRETTAADFLSQVRPHTPIEVIGLLQKKRGEPTPDETVIDQYMGKVRKTRNYEVVVQKVKILNERKTQQVIKHGHNYPPEQRHLQFRTDDTLRYAIRRRSFAMALCRKRLFMENYDEIETPVLFKSTPEGAREFIVPTRQKGMAYALPQSPQQYKQLLMASGFHRYFQFAKCFRDEDLRADRQPEFTQLDLEASFAEPDDIKTLVQRLLNATLIDAFNLQYRMPITVPFSEHMIYKNTTGTGTGKHPDIPQITYADAMRYYGSDKPNLLITGHVVRVEQWLSRSMISMITKLEDPIVEAIKLSPRADRDVNQSREFVQSFMDSPAAQPYKSNPDGMLGVAVVDSTKPLNGLAAFGHEAAEKIIEALRLEESDMLFVQARPDKPVHGGSTPLGQLRSLLWKQAVDKELIRISSKVVAPVWVTDFPLFSPLAEDDLKHTSASGICSTHHPFTSPVPTLENIEKLKTNPLEVIGDHFDLVINGIEVGGGSRRIHDADMQEYVFRDILKLPEERIKDFSHLLKALGDGCPPHVGFALGFDRLLTILCRVPSVKDVIAFPKTGNGEDKFVGAPAPLTEEQLRTYHLAVASEEVNETTVAEPKVSEKA